MAVRCRASVCREGTTWSVAPYHHDMAYVVERMLSSTLPTCRMATSHTACTQCVQLSFVMLHRHLHVILGPACVQCLLLLVRPA
jgi:hypothetical protein